jgi:hypothetical protein
MAAAVAKGRQTVAPWTKEQSINDHRLKHAEFFPAVQHIGGKAETEGHGIEMKTGRQMLELQKLVGEAAKAAFYEPETVAPRAGSQYFDPGK